MNVIPILVKTVATALILSISTGVNVPLASVELTVKTVSVHATDVYISLLPDIFDLLSFF